MNAQIPEAWKVRLSRLVRRRPFSFLLALAVNLIVPRQRLGAALVTFNSDEEVLLLRHVFRPANPWGLPGGWLDRNESPSDCLKRELLEEIGLQVDLGPPLLASYISPPSHVVIAYLGWLRPGRMNFSGEILEARWFPLDRLPEPLWPFNHQAIAAGLDVIRSTPQRAAARMDEGRQPA